MELHNWFLPHKETHKKAHLISWEALFCYVLIFIILQVSFSIVSFIKPGVLGITSQISQKNLIELTNQERQKNDLPTLSENSSLSQAAYTKAKNMFTENYWAHFAPSGKTPWDFILGAGYRFTFAGENLAKNFYTDDEVVKAWMVSPTHKGNILNPKYQDIGMAVVEGVLNGQKTTLVVQMFGTTTALAALPSVNINGHNFSVKKNEYESAPQFFGIEQQSLANSFARPFIDPFQASRALGVFVIFAVIVLLTLDFAVLKKRGVFRLNSNHLAHIAFLTTAAAITLTLNPGSIL